MLWKQAAGIPSPAHHASPGLMAQGEELGMVGIQSPPLLSISSFEEVSILEHLPELQAQSCSFPGSEWFVVKLMEVSLVWGTEPWQ